MLEDITRAVGLMLVFEGIMPFLLPDRWRNMVETIASVDDKMIRFIGLFSMLAGLCILIYWR